MIMKIKRTYKLTSKIAAFLMTILMFSLMLGCILGGILMDEADVYSLSKEEFLEEKYQRCIQKDLPNITNLISQEGLSEAQMVYIEQWCNNRNFASVEIYQNYSDAYGTYHSEQKIWSWNNENAEAGYSKISNVYIRSDHPDLDTSWLSIHITLAKEPFLVHDDYQDAYRLTSFLYTMRLGVYVIAIITLFLAILCFIYLMHASGKHPNEEGVRAGWGTAIPLDILTLGTVSAFIFLLDVVTYFFHNASSPLVLIPIIPMVMLSETILIGWSMSFALRTKLGKWWRNTLIFHLGCLLLKLTKAVAKWIIELIKQIPLIPKATLAITTITLFELLILIIFWEDGMHLLFWWIAEKLILLPIILYTVIFLSKLKQGGNALATGDFNYQIDTKYMFWDLKQHGENLNNIAQGTSLALEERMKSERLKTELITNVSHDIKTPLTSIINYADLLHKEVTNDSCETDSISMNVGKFQTIKDYSSILLRHSERLKRLIEDLIEASKASTGNIEVNLEPCDTAILLTQAAGEYEQKLTSARLSIITKQPEEPIFIMADGRRLWRIFDNLLNNICKYAQMGTRVYLTLEKQDDFAIISFKNTSRDALNVSADELMERFVRGDASRHTEGNGLGLSITKSLTELQNGTMELDIDADLFKVILRFPIIK